jgi:hypothetical protein
MGVGIGLRTWEIVTQQNREAAFAGASGRRLDCMREKVYDTLVQTSFVDLHVSCRHLDEAGQCSRRLHVG